MKPTAAPRKPRITNTKAKTFRQDFNAIIVNSLKKNYANRINSREELPEFEKDVAGAKLSAYPF